MQEAIFKLSDGRSLSYAVYGQEGARPVLYFHGTPSSRKEPMLLHHYGKDLEGLLRQAGLKLIAIDRPGMGFSSFNPKGDFLSFADDVAQFCHRLGIAACPLLCWSGGGPYALAMAWRYPQQVSSVHIICSFTRKFDREVSAQMGKNKWYFWAARYTPVALRLSMNVLSRQTIRSSVPRSISGLSEEDYLLLQKPEDLEAMSRVSLKSAVHLGAKGAVYEARGYFRDFGFQLQEVRQAVHYWWGTKDAIVIRLHPEELEQKLQRAVMHYREREGHLSLYVNCFEEILQVISSAE